MEKGDAVRSSSRESLGGQVTGSIPEVKKGDGNTVSTPSSHVNDDLKAGDLIRVVDCSTIFDDPIHTNFVCCCSFCKSSSSRVGVVIEAKSYRCWDAMFDFGMWEVSQWNLEKGHIEVISETG